MLSSLDAALGSSSGPRAAAFKPKQKPRARKADAGQAAESAAAGAKQLGPGPVPAAPASALPGAHDPLSLLPPPLAPSAEVPGARDGSQELPGQDRQQLRGNAVTGRGEALKPRAVGAGADTLQGAGAAADGAAADARGLGEPGLGWESWHGSLPWDGTGTLGGPPPTRGLPGESLRGTPAQDAALLAGGEGGERGHAAVGEGMASEELLDQYVEVASPNQQATGGQESAGPADPAATQARPAQQSTKRKRIEAGAGEVFPEEGGVSVDRDTAGANQGATEALDPTRMEGRELRSGRRVLPGNADVHAEEGYQDTAAETGRAGAQAGGRGSRGKRGTGTGARGRGRGPARKTPASSGPDAGPAEGTVGAGGGGEGPGAAPAAPPRPRLIHGVPRGRRRPVETSVLAETDMGLLTLNQIIQRAEALEKMVTVVDGRIVVNESTLSMSARAQEDVAGYRRVDESTPRLNYHTHLKIERAERWTPEETHRWFQALRQFGTDFEMLQCLFPGRTRRQMKAKFKKEERLNPDLITYALQHRPSATDQAPYRLALGAINPELLERAQQMVQDSALGLGEYAPGSLGARGGGGEASQATEDSGARGDSGDVDDAGPGEGGTVAAVPPPDPGAQEAPALPRGPPRPTARGLGVQAPSLQTAGPPESVPESGARGHDAGAAEQAGSGRGGGSRGTLAAALAARKAQRPLSEESGPGGGRGYKAAPAEGSRRPSRAVQAPERPVEPLSKAQVGGDARSDGHAAGFGTAAPKLTEHSTQGSMPLGSGAPQAGPDESLVCKAGGQQEVSESEPVDEDDPFALYNV